MYFEKVGKGPEKIIIPAGFLLFDDFNKIFDPVKHTVLFYDMRNRGRSNPEYDSLKLNIHQDVKDLEELRQRFDFEKTTLIGYSYLGLMVAMYTTKYPEKVERIVQIGPIPFRQNLKFKPEFTHIDSEIVMDTVELNQLRKLRKDNYQMSHPKEYCKREWDVTKYTLIGNRKNVDNLGDGPCDYPNEWPIHLVRHFYHHFYSVMQVNLTAEDFGIIHCPVLTIHGTRDRNAPYGSGREWCFNLPNAKLLTVQDAAHNSWDDEPLLVKESIVAFLSGNWPEGAVDITTTSLE